MLDSLARSTALIRPLARLFSHSRRSLRESDLCLGIEDVDFIHFRPTVEWSDNPIGIYLFFIELVILKSYHSPLSLRLGHRNIDSEIVLQGRTII